MRILPGVIFAYFFFLDITGFLVPGGSGWGYQNAFVGKLAQAPKACVIGDYESDYERRKCGELWTSFATEGAMALLPLLLAGVLLYLANDEKELVYRRARKRVEKGDALFKGIVTDPPVLPKDAFAFLACMNVMSLQLANGTQMKVYLPETSPKPRPGETLAVFDVGKTLGAKRYVGVFYAPHLAIVRGGVDS